MIINENRLPADDCHEISCFIIIGLYMLYYYSLIIILDIGQNV